MWPTRKQWNLWTLPSKLTAIGAWVGMVSLLLALLTFVFQSPKPPNNGTTIVGNSSSAVRSHSQMEASGHINVQVTGNSENIQILTLRSSQRIPKAKLRLVDIYLEGNFIDVKLKNSGGDSAFVTRALIQIFSDPDIIQNCIQTGAMEYVYSMEFGGQKVGIRGQIFGFENLISAI